MSSHRNVANNAAMTAAAPVIPLALLTRSVSRGLLPKCGSDVSGEQLDRARCGGRVHPWIVQPQHQMALGISRQCLDRGAEVIDDLLRGPVRGRPLPSRSALR